MGKGNSVGSAVKHLVNYAAVLILQLSFFSSRTISNLCINGGVAGSSPRFIPTVALSD